MLPNTFIVGVQKCGTTALHHLLNQHPDVFFPTAPQEIHFFDVEDNFRRGLEWFETLFHEWDGEPVIAQTSPLYFFEPVVPARIHTAVPHARFIVILRNPIDRAYSHYWHEVKHGFEKLTFEEALDHELDRIGADFDSRRHYSYVARGEYGTQFARYLEYFPRERFLVLLFDDLARNVDTVLRRCADFLEIPFEGFAASRHMHGVRNAARMPRSRIVHRVGRRLSKWAPTLAHAIMRVNAKQVQYPTMNRETRQMLQLRLNSEIKRTALLTGLDLGTWLGDQAGSTK